MIPNILRTITYVCLGALVSGLAVSHWKPASSTSENGALTVDCIRQVLKNTKLRVPVNAVGTSERAISADDADGNVLQIPLSSPPQPLVFVTGQLEYAVDLESSASLSVTTDIQRKTAIISLPPPRFVDVTELKESVALAYSSVSETDLNPIRNETEASIRRRGVSSRNLEAAKADCAGRIAEIVSAFGYTPQIVWCAPVAQNSRPGPL